VWSSAVRSAWLVEKQPASMKELLILFAASQPASVHIHGKLKTGRGSIFCTLAQLLLRFELFT
jgi:hypothetical protein